MASRPIADAQRGLARVLAATGTLCLPPRPPHQQDQPCHGEQGEGRPEEEPVLRREQHVRGVRRGPRHLAADEARRPEAAVQREVRGRLRQVDQGGGRGPRQRGAGGAPAGVASPRTTPRSMAGPMTTNASCSRTMAMRPASAPRTTRPRDRPAVAHDEPGEHERRDGERRGGVREARRDVHVEEQRRAEARGHGRERGAVGPRATPPRRARAGPRTTRAAARAGRSTAEPMQIAEM